MATKLSYTFGSSHNENYVVPSCKAHYFGRGTQNNNGIGIAEASKAISLTKPSSPRLPSLTSRRGLDEPS